MKRVFFASIFILFVYGCTKKMAPTNNTNTASNTPVIPADANIGNGTESTTANAQTEPAKTSSVETNKTEKEATADLNQEDLASLEGQRIYNAKCGRCHGLKTVADYTADRWTGILASMAPKARLTDAEKESVYTYVKMNSKK